MKTNLIYSIIILIILNGCGFTPVYQNIDNVDFKIQIKEVIGERKINNLIKSNLKNYSYNNSEKIYKIKVNTKYSKNIIAKDSTGAASEYKIVIEATITVNSTNYEDELKFKESFNMQSMSDKLDEQDYEQNIQSNLVNTIIRKFILRLSRLK